MKVKWTNDTSCGRGVFNKTYKDLISRTEGLCSRCPYHRGENADRKRKDRRNWKRYRRTRWREPG
jgi:hypothetical protein